MKRFWMCSMLLVLSAFIFSAGCSKRQATQPESQPQAQKQAEKQPEAAQPSQKIEPVTEQKVAAKVETVESKEAATPPVETEGMFKDILFDYDKYDVKEDYKALLKEISAWLLKNSDAKISIEGHCDERGTNEYNLALGDRRAKAVRDFLVSLGVSSSKIETISYGEEKALCSEQTEECWQKNRRAHFVVLTKASKS